jgi:hypothetical protein
VGLDHGAVREEGGLLLPLYLPYISPMSPLYLPRFYFLFQVCEASFFPYISPISPLYLPHISPISPLYLPYISTTGRYAKKEASHTWKRK